MAFSANFGKTLRALDYPEFLLDLVTSKEIQF